MRTGIMLARMKVIISYCSVCVIQHAYNAIIQFKIQDGAYQWVVGLPQGFSPAR